MIFCFVGWGPLNWPKIGTPGGPGGRGIPGGMGTPGGIGGAGGGGGGGGVGIVLTGGVGISLVCSTWEDGISLVGSTWEEEGADVVETFSFEKLHLLITSSNCFILDFNNSISFSISSFFLEICLISSSKVLRFESINSFCFDSKTAFSLTILLKSDFNWQYSYIFWTVLIFWLSS